MITSQTEYNAALESLEEMYEQLSLDEEIGDLPQSAYLPSEELQKLIIDYEVKNSLITECCGNPLSIGIQCRICVHPDSAANS